MENPKVVLLIFTSGKIVLAGAKTRKDVYTAYQKIYPVLFSFKKRNVMNSIENKVVK
jgi:transcription initiation factor TFIID TATA-box-binding protein